MKDPKQTPAIAPSETEKGSNRMLEMIEGVSPHSDEMLGLRERFWNEIILPEVEEEYKQVYPGRDWSNLSFNPSSKNYARYCREYWDAALAWQRNRPAVRHVEGSFYYLGIRSGYGHLNIDNLCVSRLTTEDLVWEINGALKSCVLSAGQLKKVRRRAGWYFLALWLVAVVASLIVGLRPLPGALTWVVIFSLLTVSLATVSVLLDRLMGWEGHS